jgi:4-alpha-glucanotransferase
MVSPGSTLADDEAVTGATGDLARLADRMGIVAEYIDNDRVRRITSADTSRVLLNALGLDASSDVAVSAALAAQREADRSRLLAPFAVCRADPRRGTRVTLTVPAGCEAARAEVCIVLRHESGGETLTTRRLGLPATSGKQFSVTLSECPGPGYHSLSATLACAGREWQGEQQLVVHPGRCAMPLENGERVFGVWANLYTLRSARNWGFGDFTDLDRLAAFAGSAGAAFTGVNPLHALRDVVGSTSPYSPVSRLFINPLYLDVEAVPELGQDSGALAALSHPTFMRTLANARAQDRLDYPTLWGLKRPMLRALHRAFVQHQDADNSSRGREYRAWCSGRGELLDDFATFMALSDAQTPDDGSHRDWHTWPAALQDPRSPEVASFAREQEPLVDFHRWLQFECDRQLGAAAETARSSGQRLGIYQDMAIGTPPSAADPWSHPDLFVDGVRIGCPPDAFASEGQNWNLTPLSPLRLMQTGWRYWRAVLRATLAHAGVLRIDHIMGLFRQYWIPVGASGKHGAYVRFPSDALLGILALESSRHDAVVVGEDLGTVPQGFSSRLAHWNILSSRVALFERKRSGEFKPASTFSKRALLTANTHDLPPLDALWGEDDLLLRRQLGQIVDDNGLDAARRERMDLQAALRRRIIRAGTLAADACPPSAVDSAARIAFRRGVYAWLCGTPTPLLGVSLDDLCGETEPVNIPGLGEEIHPSWSRRMGVSLEDLPEHPGLVDLLADLKERGGRRPEAEP